MTATVASMGHQAKLGVAEETTYGTAVPATRSLVFVSESLKKTGAILERQGIRGTRSHNADDTRIGPYTVGGNIVLEPTPEDLAILLPWVLGTDVSVQTYSLAETLQPFTVTIDRVAKVFTYAGCVVSRATFSGTKGGYLQVSLDLVGKSESVAAAGSYPSIAAAGVTSPFVFTDTVLTLAAAVKECESFELVIDNGVIADRFMNSLTIINAPTGDRMVTLKTSHPYAAGTGTTGNTDLYGQALAGAAGLLVLTAGNYSMSCTFGTLQVADNSPTVASKAEIMLALDMVARQTGSTKEIEITLDSTP